MRFARRSIGTSVLLAMTGGLAFVSVAWACTAQVGIAPLPVQAAPPEARVAVSGDSTGPGVVEVRWNSVRGPLLATATANAGAFGTGFSTDVTIPRTSPGVYYFVLVAGDRGIGRAAIEVTASTPASGASGPAAQPVPAVDLWDGLSMSSEQSSQSGGSGGPSKAGVALLAVGLVGLVGGGVVAGARGTRSRAEG